MIFKSRRKNDRLVTCRANVELAFVDASDAFNDVFASKIVINLFFFEFIDQIGKRDSYLLSLLFFPVCKMLIESDRRSWFDQEKTLA